MKSVLITGGSGYIGGYVTDLFREKGYDVVVYDNLLYEERYLKDVKFIYGDVRDTARLLEVVKLYDIDTVIWLAAIVGDGACAVDPAFTREVNYFALKNFSDQVSKDVKIVFTSTCSVYGANSGLLTEKSVPNPLSVYARTKLEAEIYLRETRPDSLVFRLGTLFGIGDRHSRLRFDLVVNILTVRAVLGEELTVFGGEQWRPLLHVRDVARGIKCGLEKNCSGLYNLSYKNYKICDVADELVGIVGKGTVKKVDIKYEDFRDYQVDNRDFRIDSGFEPIYLLETGVKEVASLIEENRIKSPYADVYHNERHVRGLK